jgi:hypothetical protein
MRSHTYIAYINTDRQQAYKKHFPVTEGAAKEVQFWDLEIYICSSHYVLICTTYRRVQQKWKGGF